MPFDISNINKLFTEFTDFMYEQKIMGFFIGTFTGIASSNLITSFKKNVLDYILTRLFNLGNSNSLFFITSIIEFILMLIVLYFIVKLVKPYFDKKNIQKKEEDVLYQVKLLDTLNNINQKLDKQ